MLDSNRNIDIFTPSETHLSKSFNEQLFNIERYTFINRPRENVTGGGVAWYLKESINWKRRQDLEIINIENITIEIFPHKCNSFLIITVYKPPIDSKYLFKNFDNDLNEIITSALSTQSQKVIPIYKSGPVNAPENYRPVSVLPVLSKVIERAV